MKSCSLLFSFSLSSERRPTAANGEMGNTKWALVTLYCLVAAMLGSVRIGKDAPPPSSPSQNSPLLVEFVHVMVAEAAVGAAEDGRFGRGPVQEVMRRHEGGGNVGATRGWSRRRGRGVAGGRGRSQLVLSLRRTSSVVRQQTPALTLVTLMLQLIVVGQVHVQL